MKSKNSKQRRPNQYRLRPLIDPAKIKGKWQELESLYTKEWVKRMREYASVVMAENDPDAVAAMLEMVPPQAEATLKKAVKLLSEKAVDNPKRSLRYLLGTYERMRLRGE